MGDLATAGVVDELRALFASQNAEPFVHVVDLSDGSDLSLNPDEPVVLAGVFKIAILLEFARQSMSGVLSPTKRVRITAADQVFGMTGLSVLLDDVELSLRDLATMMMSVSDNTATDYILQRVGLDRVNATLQELGLKQTVLVGDSLDALLMLPQDLDYSISELLERFPRIPPEQMRRWRALYPEHTNRSTPREMTTLLRLIAENRAGSAEACEEVRRIMSLQVWPHRLRSGFGDDVRVWAKIGTLPGIRNEVGVVEFPDGGRYAVAIFTRTASLTEREPEVDRVIGRAAARALDALRAR